MKEPSLSPSPPCPDPVCYPAKFQWYCGPWTPQLRFGWIVLWCHFGGRGGGMGNKEHIYQLGQKTSWHRDCDWSEWHRKDPDEEQHGPEQHEHLWDTSTAIKRLICCWGGGSYQKLEEVLHSLITQSSYENHSRKVLLRRLAFPSHPSCPCSQGCLLLRSGARKEWGHDTAISSPCCPSWH